MDKTGKYFIKGLLYGVVAALLAYFGYKYRVHLQDYYHRFVLVGWHNLDNPAYPFLAWTLFAMLALAMIFFIFQAWQEQNLVEVLVGQLMREKNLLDQKHNFIVLTSHYLRTPLTLIVNGIDLMHSMQRQDSQIGNMSISANNLKTSVESLLSSVSAQPSLITNVKPPKSYRRYMFGAAAGGFLAISLGIYSLAHPELFQQNLKSETVLAVALVAMVMIYTTYRGRQSRKLLKDHYGKMIIDQRNLDMARNILIKNGLDRLKPSIAQLHAQLQAVKDPKYSKPVVEGLHRFEAILQKFIILAGLETGTMTTIRQPVELGSVIGDIQKRYGTLMQQRGIQLETKLKLKKLDTDPLLLEYVIESLVNNSVKFASGGRPITIRSKKGPHKSAEIRVSDRGPGIPAQKLDLIFKPFSRAQDAAVDFEHEGMGLSLYLDKLIMQYIGGSISAEPNRGSGTTFKLALSA